MVEQGLGEKEKIHILLIFFAISFCHVVLPCIIINNTIIKISIAKKSMKSKETIFFIIIILNINFMFSFVIFDVIIVIVINEITKDESLFISQ